MAVNKNFRSQQTGFASVDIKGQNVTTGGGLVSLPNPEKESLVILRSFLHVRTPSTGAANLNAGIGATETTDANDILSAFAVGGAITGKTYNAAAQIVAAETELGVAKWDDGEFLTITGSADTTGLDAVLIIEYVRVGTTELE